MKKVWLVVKLTRRGLVVYSIWSTANKAEKALRRYRKNELVPRGAEVVEENVDTDGFRK